MVNKMCDNGVFPCNKVFCPSKDTKENKIKRNGEIFCLEDTLDYGFQMKLYHLDYLDEIVDCSYAMLDSYEDFLCFMDVDTILHYICCKECGEGSFLRNDERRFYHELKKLEKLVGECQDFREKGRSEHVIFIFFKGIYYFIREYKEGFKHKNKKIEKKFNKIGKKIDMKIENSLKIL